VCYSTVTVLNTNGGLENASVIGQINVNQQFKPNKVTVSSSLPVFPGEGSTKHVRCHPV